MDSGQLYRASVLEKIPPLRENAIWRRIDPRDSPRIDCDRVHLCGDHATWATVQGTLYVCDYHRYICEIERVVSVIQIEQQESEAAA
jgi:hypothetical protein